MKRSRFEEGFGGERRTAEERSSYNEERRRDSEHSHQHGRRNNARLPSRHNPSTTASGGGPEEAILDEDLLICPTFEQWKSKGGNVLLQQQQQPNANLQDLVPAYCEHVKQWVAARTPTFVDRHWHEDWFLERYDPERAIQRRKLRISSVAKRASEVSPSALVPLVAGAPGVLVSGLELSMSEGGSQCFLPSVPTNAPRPLLEKVLMEKHGALEVWIGETNRSARRKDLCRKAIVTFKDAQSARDLIKQESFSLFVAPDADGVLVESTSEADARRQEVRIAVLPSRTPQNRILPAQEAERASKDQEQALACARALDNLFGLEAAQGVDAFVSKRAENIILLDAVIQYLRFVHLYCYFTGIWFKDMGEMLQKSATPFLRSASPANVPSGGGHDDRKFFEAVDACAGRILAPGFASEFAAEEERLAAALERRNALSAQSVEEYMQANTIKVPKEENKTHYQCRTHNKLFETETFLRKHLTNFHAADIRVASRQALRPLLLEQFALDEDRALPRLPRFVDEALRDEFVPPHQHVREQRDYQQQHHAREHQPPLQYRDSYRGEHQAAAEPAAPPPRYRDPDAVAPTATGGKVKLQYRTRVSYAETQ